MERFLLTIDNVQNMMDRKIFSCEELVKTVCDNIAYLGCATGAYITASREKAIAEARKIDNEGRKTPLSGIPIAIKDNICTKDMLTTAGSRILEKFIPPYDATVVERLREQGAIIIGKTNMDEFGMGSSCENSAYKSTANPVDYTFVPGGSSGGSAAAVKSGLAIASLGTDTGGSIRQPAAFCGIYGLKPTYSLVSRYGLIAFASSLDVIGPMCQSTKDCAILLNAIAGRDARDMTCSDNGKKDYVTALDRGVNGLKIGIIREMLEACDEDIANNIMQAVKVYENMGAKVSECSLNSLKYVLSTYYVISSAEASSNLARYDGVKFTRRAKEYNSFEEMLVKSRSEGFGNEAKKRILLGTFVLSKGNFEKYYMKAEAARALITKEFESLLEEFDILIAPVSEVPVWKRGEKSDAKEDFSKGKCTAGVNLAGLPAISVPCGTDRNNMPVGMQLIGRKFDEETLLIASYAYETYGGE